MTSIEQNTVIRLVLSFIFTSIVISLSWFFGVGWALGSVVIFVIAYNVME